MKVLSVSSTRQTMESDFVSQLFSVRLVSGAAGRSQEDQPAQIPSPTPSHPSSFPSAHLATLESRILQLEERNTAARISEVEVAVADISVLKASVAQIPALQDEVKRLEAERRKSEAQVPQWATELKARMAGLETQVNGLVVENVGLKDQVTELEARLQDHDETRDISMMSGVIFHSPPRAIHSPPKEIPPPKANDVDDHGKDVQIEVAVGSGVAPTYVVPLPNSSHY
jgi:uncharacterized small protein (DUF1192 family)